MRGSPWLVAIVAVAFHAGVAGAQPARGAAQMSADARARLERGLRYFDTQEYDAAIAEFKAGYQAEPHADFLYALAQAQRLNGNCRDAVGAYRSFLRAGPPEEEAQLARQNLDKCEVALREEQAKVTPAPAPPPPSAPKTPPRVAPAPSPVADEAEPFYTDVLGDVLCGVGLVGLAVGGTLFGLAFDRAASADDGTLDEYERSVDAATDLRSGAIVATAAGGSLIIAGVIRFATRPETRRPRSGAAVGVGPGSIWLRGSF